MTPGTRAHFWELCDRVDAWLADPLLDEPMFAADGRPTRRWGRADVPNSWNASLVETS